MYQKFKTKLSPFIIFSKNDISKEFKDFDFKALVRWQNKGYIVKIRNKFYCFSDVTQNEHFLFYAANKIYSHSYISMESALSYYNIIPEGVYTITSIATLKTNSFETKFGTYKYRFIKTPHFFGYRLINYHDQNIKIADLEKTVLDYLYLNNKIQTTSDFEGLRWNRNILHEMNKDVFNQYIQLFNSKTLNKRVKKLIKYINA